MYLLHNNWWIWVFAKLLGNSDAWPGEWIRDERKNHGFSASAITSQPWDGNTSSLNQGGAVHSRTYGSFLTSTHWMPPLPPLMTRKMFPEIAKGSWGIILLSAEKHWCKLNLDLKLLKIINCILFISICPILRRMHSVNSSWLEQVKKWIDEWMNAIALSQEQMFSNLTVLNN